MVKISEYLKVKTERYYGSDLNRLVDEKCSHQMSCINIDCLLVKVSKKRIRIIESKHGMEPIPKSQLAALKILNYITSTSASEWQIEYYIVRGDPPYENANILDFINGKQITVSKQELIEWLNFEKEVV
jgi:hypothetical protein